MPTNNKRINLALPPQITTVLEKVAKRDNVPTATKVAELLNIALDLEEDMAWDKRASERDKARAVFIPHDDVWV